jgi:hypothetical protein
MDPIINEYLGRLKQDTIELKDAILLRMEKQTQSEQLSDLCNWKPDQVSRFDKIQSSVVALERAHFAAMVAPGGLAAPHLGVASLSAHPGEVHELVGHGEYTNPRGFRRPFARSWVCSYSRILYSRIILNEMQFLDKLWPLLALQHLRRISLKFTGENPNPWKTLVEQYFHNFAILETYWAHMSTLHW